MKLLTSSYWSSLSVICTRALFFLFSLSLTVFLEPRFFGELAIVLSYLLLISSLANFGIESALISLNKNEIKSYLNTAWTLEFLKGLFVASIIFFSAEIMSNFVKKDLTSLIELTSIAPLILALKNIRIAELRKNLNIKPLFIIELSQVLSYISFSYIFIYYSAETKSIIYGYIIGCFVYSFFSYFCISYIPKFEFNKIKITRIFNFSKWYILSTQISILLDNSLQILSGRISSLAYLGNFERADFISRKSSGQIGEIFWKFALPAFSNQENPKKLFLSLNAILILLTFYFSFFILNYGEHLIGYLNKDIDIKEFLFPLFLISIMTSFSIMPSILLVSKAKTFNLFIISFARLIIISCLVAYFFNELSILLLIKIYTIAIIVNIPLAYFFVRKIIKIDIIQIIKPALMSFLGLFALSIIHYYLNINIFIHATLMSIFLAISISFFIDDSIKKI